MDCVRVESNQMWNVFFSLPFWAWVGFVSLLAAILNKECFHREENEQQIEMLTKECHLLSDSVDIYDGPQRTADAQPTVEEDGFSFIDAVENSSMAIGPERQNVVLQGQSLRQSFGPVARPCHQVWACIFWDVSGNQFTGVQTGETKTESPTPAGVHTTQSKTHLNKQH